MKKQILGAAGLLTAGLLAGGAMSISAASAADSTATSVTSTSTDSSTTDANAPAGAPDIFSSTSVRPDEKNVTGDDKAKLEAAALAEVPGATVIRAETDGNDGATYEVHMKKADGSVVTVEFDANFKVTGTHDGFAKGGANGGPHGPRGDQDGDATTGSTSFTAPTITG